MNLKSIKLAGFKSFVDPTVIPINANLTGIVGPNGCGKSNVVDAIRWVIGESSAKQLRGESMADVIFNGAGGRKPVGMAAVELIFDNSDGRIAGEYAKFSEISIRREVHREGQSQYSLNGVQCRRRDITNLFLGTGLGARSYSIIEQGVISELIEAKPEELRVHLEEVSGISKYKERRRETETRMRHTQENLDRLNDLNEELSKQLRHLKRQAEAAERYTELKQQERTLQAEIKVLQWQGLNQQLANQEAPLTQCQLTQDEQLTHLREIETAIEKSRIEHVEANAKRDEVQKQFYGLGAGIARLEQRIQHCQEQILRWRKEQSEVESLYEELAGHTEEQRQNIEELTAELTELAPQTAVAKTAAHNAGQALQAAEQRMHQWQQRWDGFQTESAQFVAQIGILKANLQHYDQQLTSLNSRHAQLLERQKQLPLSALAAEIDPLTAIVVQHRQALETLQASLAVISDSIRGQRQQNLEAKQNLDHQRQQLQTLQSRHASLDALQQSALGYHDDHTKAWLSQYSLASRPRLGQVLQVNSGWELAVETVLGGYFDAVCLDNLDHFIESMTQISQGHLTLIDLKRNPGIAVVTVELPLLATQIGSQWLLSEWLSGVYVAENLAQALTVRDRLDAGESIITRDGIWLGKNWARVNKAVDKNNGILVREQELKQLSRDIASVRELVLDQQSNTEQGEKNLRQLEEQRDLQHHEYQNTSTHLTEAQTQLSGRQSRFTELQQQQQRLVREISECEQSIQNLQGLLEKNRGQLSHFNQVEKNQAQQQAELLQERDQRRQELDEARQKAGRERQSADELAVRAAAVENQLVLLKQSSLRDARQQQQLEERRELLANHLAENEEPFGELRVELQQQLELRLNIEQTLRASELALAEAQQQLEQLTKAQQHTQERLALAKTQWQNLQMERQAILVRQTTIQEQLTEQNWVLNDLTAALASEANLPEWEKQLETVTARVNRLGPINLAAIDECQAVSERKIYLDKQQADLNEALDILKTAINKIDRETRTQFQETFNQVNQNFQALFPQIFGGGKAMLELSEDDWLTAGILVKAQPPGKRNATIHMLSGGEKALTAVALVFSMFKINPAPFCVLDEVDAPLDDMNTGRFCQLVKEMAKTTQFIVISHNKVTISMSERLMGVTMQEAGVSRIVSVDVAEAVALAEA